jgi:hypothetical protein
VVDILWNVRKTHYKQYNTNLVETIFFVVVVRIVDVRVVNFVTVETGI